MDIRVVCGYEASEKSGFIGRVSPTVLGFFGGRDGGGRQLGPGADRGRPNVSR